MAEGGQDEDSGDVMLAGAAAADTTTTTTTTTAAANGIGIAIKPPSVTDVQAQQPIALTIKSEESDRESSVGSPEPASTMGIDGATSLYQNQQLLMMNALQNRSSGVNSDQTSDQLDHAKVAAAAAAHLNGTMAGMLNLQNLQNLASLQNLPQVASLAAGLQSISNLAGNQAMNGPLNLSVSAAATAPTSTNNGSNTSNLLTNTVSNQTNNSLPSLLAAQQPIGMPQFILASGQLVHGIQGAQLLIPTSQGIATQTILTIPVNHVNSNDQMVNLALNNGQVVTTSLANLQAMAQPHHLLTSVANTMPTTNNSIASGLINPSTLPHLLNTGPTSAQQLISALQPQMMNTVPPPPPLLNPSAPPPQMMQQTQQSSTQNQQPSHRTANTHTQNHHYPESKLHPQSISVSRTSSASSTNSALNSISRLAATNGELTITTSHGPTSSQHPMKVPSPPNMSPTCTDNSTADLLVDSPNQPTINQTSSNVVDGINLDEIKEFAKAFKLRRLSLGLTQTQVGQALSITEGPAYSQSAICSALASQMYCAQLSSQQQAMFEKLDITPKSAQKIKPVLERWMKEAEERYKSGQNHLTDFIGVEPSKKRKRRTSFTPQALELLNAHFERNTHPSGTEITGLAHQLGYEREVIRIWFCNKRQALKNTVRMMSKGMV